MQVIPLGYLILLGHSQLHCMKDIRSTHFVYYRQYIEDSDLFASEREILHKMKAGGMYYVCVLFWGCSNTTYGVTLYDGVYHPSVRRISPPPKKKILVHCCCCAAAYATPGATARRISLHPQRFGVALSAITPQFFFTGDGGEDDERNQRGGVGDGAET